MGHHLIARSAVEILKSHPSWTTAHLSALEQESFQSFFRVFKSKQYQQGHLSNIPDTYWRNLEHGMEEVGTLLGSSSHYLDSEKLLNLMNAKSFSQSKLPLTYAQAKNRFSSVKNFFKNIGSLPWRAQQFTDLYGSALTNHFSKVCNDDKNAELSTRVILTYAGLLSHYTGDVSMPYHSSVDHDAIAVGQKGIHSYFEQDLVAELEISNLFAKVTEKAHALLNSPIPVDGTPSLESLRQRSKELYPTQLPNQETTALMMVVIEDSFSAIEKLRQLDYTYAIANLEEALKQPSCRNLIVVKELKNQYEKLDTDDQRAIFGKVKILSMPSDYHDKKTESACRRIPSERVNEDGELSSTGKTVAEWHEAFIVNRLALSAILTAEIWVKEWLRTQKPKLCSTYLYAHKPSFISPTESKCFGYALKEAAKDLLMKNGKSALTGLNSSRSSFECLSF